MKTLWQTIRIPSSLSTERTPHGGTNLIPINIEEEMRRSYLDYSMSVIIGRALPDARDGLKPVHRRILYAMTRDGPAAQQEIHKVRQGGGAG